MKKGTVSQSKSSKRILPFLVFITVMTIASVFIGFLVYSTKLAAKDCSLADDRFDCYESYYVELTKDSGVRLAVKDMRSNYDSDGFIKSNAIS